LFVCLEGSIPAGPDTVDCVGDFIEDLVVEQDHQFHQQSTHLRLLLQILDEVPAFLGLEEFVGLNEVAEGRSGRLGDAVGSIDGVVIEALLIGIGGCLDERDRGSPYLLGVGGL
jgi:hypothetical protein